MLVVIGVVATIIYVQVSTIPCGCGPVTPPQVNEKLSFNGVSVTSPTSIRLSIGDTGSTSIGLSGYYLKDSRGDIYLSQTWAGPTLSPDGSVTVGLSLTGSLSGQPFQFQSGQAYTVGLVTARNNQIPYNFTA